MPSSDVLESPAVDVLCRIEALGLTYEATPDGRFRVGPADRLPADLAAQIRLYRDDLVALAQVCDRGVQDRVVVFRRIIDRAPIGTVLPALLFREGIPYLKGRCYSCGEALERNRWGRCWRCSVASRVAARIPLTTAAVLATCGVRVS